MKGSETIGVASS